MADTKTTALGANTDPTITDLLYIIDDVGGTPTSQKITLADFLEFIPDLGAIAALDVADVVPIIDDPAGTPLAKKITTLNLAKAAMGLTTSEEFEIREVLHDETLGAAGSFDVSSISQSYDDLLLLVEVRGDVTAATDNVYMYFNNDTTVTNYHSERSYHNNAVYGTGESATPQIVRCPAASSPASAFSNTRIWIPSYTSTNLLKMALIEDAHLESAGNLYRGEIGMIWEDGGATAINRVTVVTDNDPTDEFATNSRLRIIGVKVSS